MSRRIRHTRPRATGAHTIPALVAALLGAGTVAAVPEAAAAIDPPATEQVAVAAVEAVPVGALQPYRVLRGTRFVAKPPPWVAPVQGYHLTGRFGAASSLWSSTHTGLDFAAAEGTQIRSIAPGVVESVGYDGSYGLKTVVALADGTELWYCHQSDVSVSVGTRVQPGQAIGAVGSTGNVTGAHLHLEVRPGGGDPVDPEGWLPGHGVTP